MAKYFVYILYSRKLDKFYRGQTGNLSARVKRHNAGTEISTQKGTPWILLWSTKKATRSEAVRLESKLKNLSRARTLKFMRKYQDGIRGADELLLIEQLSVC